MGRVVPAGAVSAMPQVVVPPVIAAVANRPVIVYVDSDPTVFGLGTTVIPAVPLALMVYAGADTCTVSADVLTPKSVYVPAPGFVTLATVTVMASPAAMASPAGVVIVMPPLIPGLVLTNRQFDVASDTSTPVTVVKLVGPAVSVRLIEPPAGTAVVALNPTVYVAEAPATSGEIDNVTAVTAVPKLMELVVNGDPDGANGAVPLPGVIVTVVEPAVAGLVAKAVILTIPPEAIAVVNVKYTMLAVAPGVAAVTTLLVAVPPEGVYVTV